MNFESVFLLALNCAATEQDVIKAVDDFEKSTRTQIKFVPVGGNPGNSGTINVMDDPAAALYERVMNAIDANIELELLKHPQWFTNCTLPAQAMAAMVANLSAAKPSRGKKAKEYNGDDSSGGRTPLVFVIETKAKKTPTFTVGDVGIGIHGKDFPSTILSLNQTNKVTKPLLCGSYNMGGSATYRFAGYTIIMSIPHTSPDTVYFTLVKKEHEPDRKTPTYLYATTSTGTMFSCPTYQLQQVRRSLTEMTNHTLANDAYNTVFLPPKHGTVVRHINYNIAKSGWSNYGMLREFGFGIEVPIRYLEQVGSSGKQDPIYNISGLRYVYSSTRALNDSKYPVKYHANAVTIPFGPGEISIEYWVMDTKTEKKPTEGRLSRDPTSPIFITLNGQTHDRWPTRVMLRDHFSAIDKHLIIEVNCDGLTYPQRNDVFTSTRQSTSVDQQKAVKDLIMKVLKADPEIARWNSIFANQMRSLVTDDIRDFASNIARIFNTKLSGLWNSLWGPMSEETIVTAGSAPAQRTAVNPGVPRQVKYAPIIPQDPPTFISLAGSEVFLGSDSTFVKIVTDAPGSYTEEMIIDLPDFLEEVKSITGGTTRVTFNKGHGAFQVRVKEGTPLGQTGEVRVSIAIPKTGQMLDSGFRTYTVVEPPKGMQKTQVPSMPEIEVSFVDPSMPNWANIAQGQLDASQIAYKFNYHRSEGLLVVLINTEFAFYKQMLDGFIQRHKNTAAHRLREAYERGVVTAALPYVAKEQQGSIINISEEDCHQFNAITATTLLALAALQIEEALLTDMDDDDEQVMVLPLKPSASSAPKVDPTDGPIDTARERVNRVRIKAGSTSI